MPAIPGARSGRTAGPRVAAKAVGRVEATDVVAVATVAVVIVATDAGRATRHAAASARRVTGRPPASTAHRVRRASRVRRVNPASRVKARRPRVIARTGPSVNRARRGNRRKAHRTQTAPRRPKHGPKAKAAAVVDAAIGAAIAAPRRKACRPRA